MTPRPVYIVTLRPEPGVDDMRSLKVALECLLRTFGLRCISVRREPPMFEQARQRDVAENILHMSNKIVATAAANKQKVYRARQRDGRIVLHVEVCEVDLVENLVYTGFLSPEQQDNRASIGPRDRDLDRYR